MIVRTDSETEPLLPPPLLCHEERMLPVVEDEDKSEEEETAKQNARERKIRDTAERGRIQCQQLADIRRILKKLQRYHLHFEVWRNFDSDLSKEEIDLYKAFEAFVWDLRIYAYQVPESLEETCHLLECLQAVEAWSADPFDANAVSGLEKFIKHHTLIESCESSLRTLLQCVTDQADAILIYLAMTGTLGGVTGILLMAAAEDSDSGLQIAGRILLGAGISMVLTSLAGCTTGCADALENRPAPKNYYLNHFGAFAHAATRFFTNVDYSPRESESKSGNFSP